DARINGQGLDTCGERLTFKRRNRGRSEVFVFQGCRQRPCDLRRLRRFLGQGHQTVRSYEEMSDKIVGTACAGPATGAGDFARAIAPRDPTAWARARVRLRPPYPAVLVAL